MNYSISSLQSLYSGVSTESILAGITSSSAELQSYQQAQASSRENIAGGSGNKTLLPQPNGFTFLQAPAYPVASPIPFEIGYWTRASYGSQASSSSSIQSGLGNPQNLAVGSVKNPKLTKGSYKQRNFGLGFPNSSTVYPCNTCKVRCASFSSYQMHIKSQAHLKKVERAETGFQPNEIRCELCMITVTSQEHLKAHESGAKHKKNTAAALKNPEFAATWALIGPIASSVSSVSTENRAVSNLDITLGNKISPAVNGLENLGNSSAPPQVKCEICSIFCDTQDQLNIHYGGKKHKTNVATKERAENKIQSEIPSAKTNACVCSDLIKVWKCYGVNVAKSACTLIAKEVLTLETRLMKLARNEKFPLRHAQWPGVPPLFLHYLPDDEVTQDFTDEIEISLPEEPDPKRFKSDSSDQSLITEAFSETTMKPFENYCSHENCCEIRSLRMYQAWLIYQIEHFERALDTFKSNPKAMMNLQSIKRHMAYRGPMFRKPFPQKSSASLPSTPATN